MPEPLLPNLTFPMVTHGRNETPFDLTPLLFQNGAKSRVNVVGELIEQGVLGSPILARIPLVQRIHEELTTALMLGGSKHTLRSQIEAFRRFFAWAEGANKPINLDNIETIFLLWSDSLLHRVRTEKTIQHSSAYSLTSHPAKILDRILERATPILATSSLKKKSRGGGVQGTKTDKQNLDNTFKFGRMLADVCEQLDTDVIWGPLPARIQLRSGDELFEWCGLHITDPLQLNPDTSTTKRQRSSIRNLLRNREALVTDRSPDKRAVLVNTRVEAELLMFIGQTGMNLTQAQQLTTHHFSYKSTIDGYEVKDYKHRRKGEVLFEIFSEYKVLFERYLSWRKSVFPPGYSNLLFPFAASRGRAVDERHKFWRTRANCKKLGICFIPPTQLRKTRVNWLLRRSGDPDLTADIAQHSTRTLLEVYEKPSLQVAMSEITRFWQSTELNLPSTMAGTCNGLPAPMANSPEDAPKPDCLHPSGCLWCAHHRDIDSFDYIWNLSSMRHLKTISLSGFSPLRRKTSPDPARHVQLTIDKLSTKLRWFKHSNEVRHSWVVEALERIEEAHYHPHWQHLINSLEEA